MREKAELYFADFSKALKNLADACLAAKTSLEIDGAIKRFELCYEIAWKFLKEHLEFYGVICNSPRECFKAAFKNQLISDELKWIDMIRDRNALVHVYTFEQSRSIFEKIKKIHLDLLRELYNSVLPNYS